MGRPYEQYDQAWSIAQIHGEWCGVIALGRRALIRPQDRIHTQSADVPDTWTKGLELFMKHIIRPPIQEHLVNAILDQIQYEREGNVINRSAVKGCVDVFLRLEPTQHTTVYKQILEPQFLKASERFYNEEARHLLDTCDAPEFLQRVSPDSHCS